MRPGALGGDWLVRVTPWGRQSVNEAAGLRFAEDVYELDVHEGRGRADQVLALATRWQRARHPALLPLVHASSSADGRVTRLCWQAPDGSRLSELCAHQGPMPEPMIAALLHDLAAAVVFAHGRDLTLGCLCPSRLFLAPPGSEGVAALRMLGAGLPSVIDAAGSEIGASDSQAFALLYDEPGYVAPEVAAGQLGGGAADVFALGAIAALLALGRPVFAEGPVALQRHVLEAGVGAEEVEQLRARAPRLAAAVLTCLSPLPLGRTGGLAALREATAAILGDEGMAKVSIVRGGGPWAMGSPIIPLAAWAGTTAFADRHRRKASGSALLPALRPSRYAIAASAAPADDAAAVAPGGAGADASASATQSALAQARLAAALRELDVQRALADRGRSRRKVGSIDVLVVLVTALVAASLVWVALRDTSGGPAIGPAVGAPLPPAPVPLPPSHTKLPRTLGRRER